MKFKRSLFSISGIICLLLCCHQFSYALNSANHKDAELREKQLKEAKTPTDSIKILLDVYNLSDKINRDRVRGQIINLTQKSDNDEVINNVLQELASSTDDTRDLNHLIELSNAIPDSQSKESIQTFLQMEHAESEARNVSTSEVENQIRNLATNGLYLNGDPYKEIQNIYRALVYLGTSSQGPLYYEYIKRLDELVKALPHKDHAIKNLFYTTAAIFYTRKRDYEQALDYDRRLLRHLDDMKADYEEAGDTIHDLDYFYYISYRRMLRNFKGLTPEEIEDLYSKCVQLAAEDQKVSEAFGNGGLTKSYYYVATNQFAKAVPELHKALADPQISQFRKQELLGLLAWSLRETGDKNGELEALREFTMMMLEDLDQRRENTAKEIEIRNSVNKLITDEYLAQERQRDENRVMRKTSLTLVYVLGVVLIFLCGAYFRLRSRVKELEFKNTKLRKNIEYIFDDGVPSGTKDLRHQKNRLKG